MPELSAGELKSRAAAIKVVLMDVDGVLTSGLIYHFVDSTGELVEFKGIHAQDSIALSWLAKAGLKTGIISGRQSKGVEERMKMLGATFIYQHRLDKLNVFSEICRTAKVQPSETMYLGDDLPDIPVLRAAGLGVAVANARPEVQAAAGWVTKARGGEGAVREAAEFLLSAQGRWQSVLDQFQAIG